MFNQYRDGVVLAELDSKDHRIDNALTRATELLGYPPGERRLAVDLALELRRHRGSSTTK
jgi:hypothetical protein